MQWLDEGPNSWPQNLDVSSQEVYLCSALGFLSAFWVSWSLTIAGAHSQAGNL